MNLSSNMTAQAVWENIPQQDQPITAVDISCSGYVVGGNIADAVPATSSAGVAIASYEWQDNNGTKLTSGTFAADTQYRLKVFLNVTDGYTANSLEKANVKINGTETTYITNPCVGVDAQYGDMMIYHYPARLTVPQPNEYMVSYNANGGSGTMVGDVVAENGTFTLEKCAYTAPEGCRFKAWAIGGVNGEQKQPGEQITITAETYIYAVWEKVVTFGWEDGVCTVSLQTADAENFVLAAGYEDGQLVGCAFLDTIQPSASFTCDQVRVFCVGKTAYGPACDPIPSVKPL